MLITPYLVLYDVMIDDTIRYDNNIIIYYDTIYIILLLLQYDIMNMIHTTYSTGYEMMGGRSLWILKILACGLVVHADWWPF